MSVVHKLTGYDRTTEKLHVELELTNEAMEPSLTRSMGAVLVDRDMARKLSHGVPRDVFDRCDWFVEAFAASDIDTDATRAVAANERR